MEEEEQEKEKEEKKNEEEKKDNEKICYITNLIKHGNYNPLASKAEQL